MLRGDYPASERTHLCARLDPGLGENAQALARDRALGNDHLTGQHQAGELLNLCREEKNRLFYFCVQFIKVVNFVNSSMHEREMYEIVTKLNNLAKIH